MTLSITTQHNENLYNNILNADNGKVLLRWVSDMLNVIMLSVMGPLTWQIDEINAQLNDTQHSDIQYINNYNALSILA
jgi:hypothetical protein